MGTLNFSEDKQLKGVRSSASIKLIKFIKNGKEIWRIKGFKSRKVRFN